MLAKCFNQLSSETPAEYLKPHYDEATGKMDHGIVRDAMPQTRRAIRKAHRQATREERQSLPRFSREDIYNLTEEKLIEAMRATPETVAAVFAAAESIEDD